MVWLLETPRVIGDTGHLAKGAQEELVGVVVEDVSAGTNVTSC